MLIFVVAIPLVVVVEVILVEAEVVFVEIGALVMAEVLDGAFPTRFDLVYFSEQIVDFTIPLSQTY